TWSRGRGCCGAPAPTGATTADRYKGCPASVARPKTEATGSTLSRASPAALDRRADFHIVSASVTGHAQGLLFAGTLMRARILSLFLVALFSSHLGADWPQFRGPDGQGHSPARGLPLRWSEKENIRWKTPIPGLGWSSPVIAGGQ